jgi:DNA-binding CsgD family transcriptional regulator
MRVRAGWLGERAERAGRHRRSTNWLSVRLEQPRPQVHLLDRHRSPSRFAVLSERIHPSFRALRRFTSAAHAGFLVEHDVYTDDELGSDPSYRDMLYPRGLGWSACTAVPLPTGDWFSIALERERSRGPVEQAAVRQLDLLRPHLARSALLAARLRLERAHTAAQTLAAIGLPALVINDSGRVLAANQYIEELQGCLRWLAHDRIGLKDATADRLLGEAIAHSQLSASVRSFPVRESESEQAMVLHFVPVRLSARDIFSNSVAALILTPVSMPAAPPVDLVQSLFDLTAAEARVARGLASGQTVESLASTAGVATSTIRSHVRGVLEKTGLSRQTDVVAMLAGLWSPKTTEQR